MMAESNMETVAINSDSGDENQFEPPKKRSKVYKQKYNKSWEKDQKLKGWIAPLKKDPYKAFCTLCDKELVAGLSELRKHGDSKRHKEKAKAVTTTKPITEMVTTDRTVEQVKRAEMKIAAFVVEHNLAFQVTDHLSDLVSDIFHDSAIANKFRCKHTKTRNIIKHVLADHYQDELKQTLRNSKFSIIIDESTDISAKKQLALVVRFFSETENKVKSQFAKLIEVTNSDATTLTTTLLAYFEHNRIPIENIISIGIVSYCFSKLLFVINIYSLNLTR
jgi:hypothetical protein